MHTARWDHDQRPARPAGGDDRHRRLRRAGDPLDRARGGAADGVPAHADLVPAQARQAARAVARRRRFPAPGLVRRLASQAFVELTFPLPAHFNGVVPLAKVGERVGRKHLREQVHDPVVRDKLTPRYSLGCKRPGFSNDYLPTFNRSNVALETDAIEEITPTRHAHRRRRRARGGHADPGHGLQGVRPRQHAAVPGARPRRHGPRAAGGTRTASRPTRA